MARPPSVTKTDVAKAFDTLERRGEPTTTSRIQLITGGSNTTLKPLIDAERAKRAKATDQAAGMNGHASVEGLPPAIADALAALGPAILDALADARGEERRSRDAALTAARSEADNAVRALEAELAVARSDLDDMAADVDRLRGDLEAAETARSIAEERARVVTAERDVLARQTTDLLEQLATAKAEANNLRNDAMATNAALATARTQLQQARETMTKQQRLQFDNRCSAPQGLYIPTSAAGIGSTDAVAGSDNTGPIGVAGPR